jgi:hypothetical protein
MKKIIFRQLLDFISQRTFRRATSEQKVSYDKQGLSAWEQFICMSFAQLTHCNGLRDVEACFEVMSHKVYIQHILLDHFSRLWRHFKTKKTHEELRK